jgi:membrane fusion protein (multidrug efflux system)
VDGRPHEGKVARVSPVIDPLSRSVTVYVRLDNPGGAIKGGTFATGRVVRRVLPDALILPSAAIRQRPNTGTPFVYKIAGERVAEADVTLGASDDAQEVVEMLSGVEDGDQIIVGNVGMLGDGMHVQILGGETGGAPAPRGAPGAAGGPAAAAGRTR